MSSTTTVRLDYPDDDVQLRVSSFLQSRHFPSLRCLEVDVCNGAVTLSGEVSSFYEKQVALNSCQRVAGVRRLIDDVHVCSDRAIKNSAK